MYKEKSVELNKYLKKVFKNELTVEQIIDITKNEIEKLIDKTITPDGKAKTYDHVIGRCPFCDEKVIEFSKGYKCKNEKCSFIIWKNDAFFATMKKSITETMAREFINSGQSVVRGLTSKKGNKFNALYSVEYSPGGRANYTLIKFV